MFRLWWINQWSGNFDRITKSLKEIAWAKLYWTDSKSLWVRNVADQRRRRECQASWILCDATVSNKLVPVLLGLKIYWPSWCAWYWNISHLSTWNSSWNRKNSQWFETWKFDDHEWKGKSKYGSHRLWVCI